MSRRAWIIWIVVAVLVVAGSAGGYWYVNRNRASADINPASTDATTSDLTASTATTTPSSSELTVSKGWNFVAFPYDTVTTLAALQTKAGTIEVQKIYRYTGSQWTEVTAADVLKPGTGYLVHCSAAGTIDLGSTGAKDYQSVQVPLTYGEWQLVGTPILYATKWQDSVGSADTFKPDTGFSVRLKDNSVKSVLRAVAEGYISTPLFLSNENSQYSYKWLYDLGTTTLPYNSAFWVKSKSDDVTGLIFTTKGKASTTSVTKAQLEAGDELSAPSVTADATTTDTSATE